MKRQISALLKQVDFLFIVSKVHTPESTSLGLPGPRFGRPERVEEKHIKETLKTFVIKTITNTSTDIVGIKKKTLKPTKFYFLQYSARISEVYISDRSKN